MWKPWEQSTGPRTEQGKAKVAQNAFKGGWRNEIKSLRGILREQEEGVASSALKITTKGVCVKDLIPIRTRL